MLTYPLSSTNAMMTLLAQELGGSEGRVSVGKKPRGARVTGGGLNNDALQQSDADCGRRIKLLIALTVACARDLSAIRPRRGSVQAFTKAKLSKRGKSLSHRAKGLACLFGEYSFLKVWNIILARHVEKALGLGRAFVRLRAFVFMRHNLAIRRKREHCRLS